MATIAERHAWRAPVSPNRVTGRRVKVAGPWLCYEIWYHGRHVGELFRGVGDMWYGIVFGRSTIRGKDVQSLTKTLRAMITSPRN